MKVQFISADTKVRIIIEGKDWNEIFQRWTLSGLKKCDRWLDNADFKQMKEKGEVDWDVVIRTL